jgi:hypothetical protein
MSNEEKPQVPEEPQQTAPEDSQEEICEEQSPKEPKIGFGDAAEQSDE